MWRIPVSTYPCSPCPRQDLTHHQQVNLIQGHQYPPNMGATQRSVTLEKHDLKRLYLEAMPPGWRPRYSLQTCQTLRLMTKERTTIIAMGLHISPSDYSRRPKRVPHTCVQYIDDMQYRYRTMSSKQRYQLLPSVSKNTRRKKLRTPISWTTTFDFSTENRRTKTHITKMWLCFYSTVLAYLPFDRGPVPYLTSNPTGALIITHVIIESSLGKTISLGAHAKSCAPRQQQLHL
jgi:hypothetical protein